MNPVELVKDLAEEISQALNDLLVHAKVPRPLSAAIVREEIERLLRLVRSLSAAIAEVKRTAGQPAPFLTEALNSGRGVYKP